MTRKSTLPKYDLKNTYVQLFIIATAASALLMFLYAANTSIMSSGPHFFIPGLIGAPIAMFALIGMASVAWFSSKRRHQLPKVLLVLSAVAALLLIVLTVNESIVVLTTGHLYR